MKLIRIVNSLGVFFGKTNKNNKYVGGGGVVVVIKMD